MQTRPYSKRRYLLYLIPVVIGMGGVVFSRQFDDLPVRLLVLAISLAVPLVSGGTLLVRYRTGTLERTFLFLGMLLLILGAAVSVTQFADPFFGISDTSGLMGIPGNIFTRAVGMFSLLLGLFVVLWSIVRAGEDIEEIGARFELLAEQISEGFLLLTADGVVVTVNNRFLEMSGLRREDIVGKRADELSKDLDVKPIQEHLEQRRLGRSSEYEVTWHVRGEERRFWFSGTPIFDRTGKQTASLATVRDITEQYRLSQRVERYAQSLQELVEEQTRKLRASEEKFRDLLLTMNEGFLTLDARHRIRFANARICELLGCVQDDIIGRGIFDFIDAAGRVRLLNILARGADLPFGKTRQELQLMAASGEQVPALVAVAYIEQPGDQEPLYSLVVTSVADLKQMQRELEQRALELEKANEELRMHDRAKDSFLSNVSHELRTPLSTIQGYVEMLSSESLGPLAAPQRNALEVMGRNIQRLIGLINEIIEFSRMEIRGVQVNYSLYAPVRLARDAMASAHPAALAKGVRLELEAPDAPCFAWGDPEKITQVLGILLNNAVKFTGRDGQVRVRVKPHADNSLVIEVADTGIGIDPAHHEKIFTKFYQVDSSMTRRFEGAGIGLSIAKSIVEAHGGSIGLESALGAGSTFTVRLPDTVFQAQRAMEPVLDSLRVLIISDWKDFADAVGAMLQSAGGTCTHAANAAIAQRHLEDNPPSLILINDGPADRLAQNAIASLRQHHALSTTPIVVSTGESPARIQDSGALWSDVYYLLRPFTPLVLAERLRLAVHGIPPEEFETAASSPMRDDNRPNILVIDADPGLLEWLEMALRRRHIPCCCAFTVESALQMVQAQPPDIVFADGDLPPTQVREQIDALHATPATASVPIYLMSGIRTEAPPGNGIAGLLRKPFSIDELLALIPAARAQAAATP